MLALWSWETVVGVTSRSEGAMGLLSEEADAVCLGCGGWFSLPSLKYDLLPQVDVNKALVAS